MRKRQREKLREILALSLSLSLSISVAAHLKFEWHIEAVLIKPITDTEHAHIVILYTYIHTYLTVNIYTRLYFYIKYIEIKT